MTYSVDISIKRFCLAAEVVSYILEIVKVSLRC